MSNLNTADVLRVCIIVLSVSAPILIIILNHNKRHLLGWGDVLTRIGIGAVFLAIAYSTTESFIQGLPLATRLWVLFVALVWVDFGLTTSILADRQMEKKRQRMRSS